VILWISIPNSLLKHPDILEILFVFDLKLLHLTWTNRKEHYSFALSFAFLLCFPEISYN